MKFKPKMQMRLTVNMWGPERLSYSEKTFLERPPANNFHLSRRR